MTEMPWRVSHRGDVNACRIADRHYNRQSVGSSQFVPPGRCLVLTAGSGDRAALWVTSWPLAEYTQHEWAGAWVCSIFRNEGAGKASSLIRSAVAATRALWGEVPTLGMVTFVDPTKVRPKRNPGHTFIIAGFRPCGATQFRRLPALQMLPERMPAAEPAVGMQLGRLA